MTVGDAGRGALVFVTATGTDAGKTWWTAATARVLRERGRTVVARKPAQSFAADDDPAQTDAAVLADATGARAIDVCPPHRWYPAALAPPMAAEVLDRPSFRVADLASETTWAGTPDVVFVEGAGGPRSPIAADGDNVALAHALDPALVVLVGDAGLGTINAVRLCAAALAPLPVVVALNRYSADDDLHARNREWLAARDGLHVVTRPEELADVLVELLAGGRAGDVTDARPPAARPGRDRSRTGRG